jgi:hypothetical protein
VEINLNEETEETHHALERTDTDLEINAQKDKETMSEHEKHLTLLRIKEEAKNNVVKSDALIVAALMGNTIVRMNRNRNKRFNTQMSAPVTFINSSPVPNADSVTQSQMIDERSNYNHMVSTRIEKSKSLNDQEADKMIEMSTLKAAHPKTEGASSSSNLKNAGTKTNKTSQSSKASKCTLYSYIFILFYFFFRPRLFFLFFYFIFLYFFISLLICSF